MSLLSPAQPVGVGDLLVEERKRLLELLTAMAPGDWDRPTECPAWNVMGIVFHLLGDDLSILSRQRDERPSPVASAVAARGWDQIGAIIDRFNEAWVEAAGFLSSPLLCELLRLTGTWTHNWYTTVDPGRLGEPIPWVGLEPAPYWLLAAREYLERWVHHQQIRRALGAPPLDEPRWVVPAVATAIRGFPAGLSLLPAGRGTSVSLTLSDAAAWTAANDAEGWTLYDGIPDDPFVRLTVEPADAALIFSRALPASVLGQRVAVHGDEALGAGVVAGLCAFFGAG